MAEAREEVVVYGAGGHGKVVADAVMSTGQFDVIGFVDDDPSKMGSTVLGLPILGDKVWLKEHISGKRVAVALGIGPNLIRRTLAELCESFGARLLVVVHKHAVVAPSARLEPGVAVMACAVINPDAVVGKGAIINTGAIVEHDVMVGEWAHISPNATTGGESRVGPFAQLGLGSILLPGISVGDRAIVGAGAVVVRNVSAGATVVGVPAKERHH